MSRPSIQDQEGNGWPGLAKGEPRKHLSVEYGVHQPTSGIGVSSEVLRQPHRQSCWNKSEFHMGGKSKESEQSDMVSV